MTDGLPYATVDGRTTCCDARVEREPRSKIRFCPACRRPVIERIPETRRFDVGYEDIARMPAERAVQYLVCGLLTDGAHHKQWCIEQALESMGESVGHIAEQLSPEYEFERGIAP